MPSSSAPLVSVITAVYNAERFIEPCIRSVLSQSYENWEQIIVDDGSSDATPEIIQRFDDPRIHYIRLPHRGLAALAESYNTALQASRGELIGVLEGDDEWPSDKLALQVPAFDAPEVMLSWGLGPIIDDDGRIVRRWPMRREYRRDTPLPEMFRMLTRKNILSPAVAVMVRRSALDRVGGFQQKGSGLYVDLPTWLTIAGRVAGVARFVNEDLGFYRIHATNTGKLQIAQLRMEHDTVARSVIADLGPERLAQLGWTAREERATREAASYTRGVALFQMGRRKEARACFVEALRLTRTFREFTNSVLGYVSAWTGFDLVEGTYAMRAALNGLMLRLSMKYTKATDR